MSPWPAEIRRWLAQRYGDSPISKKLEPPAIFDAAWYLAQNPDVAASGIDPWAHYIRQGAAEGRDPHPLFDSRWYLLCNPHVAAKRIPPLLHYLDDGAANGHDPHPLFDSDWYLAQNPDVAVAGENPLAHYSLHGAREGRDPHPLFDTDWYLKHHPDAQIANPLAHYLHADAMKGVSPHPLFDGDWYLAQNPDVAATGANPLAHYIAYGAREGRNPNPLFDTAWYLKQYGDTGADNPLIHYLTVGAQATYSPGPLFDSRWYLLANPDVSRSGANPLIHYILHGAEESRWPKPKPKGAAWNDRKIVIAHRGDGLGTRLLTIIQARILAETAGFDFKIIWPMAPLPFYQNEELLGQRPYNIFRGDHVFAGDWKLRGAFCGPDAMEGRRILHLSNEEHRLRDMDCATFQDFSKEFDVLLHQSPHVVPQFLWRDVHIPSETRRLWKLLSWNPEIIEAVERISRQIGLRDCIAVHIRRGDIVNMLMRADAYYLRGTRMIQIMHRYAPIQAITEKIDAVRSNENILFCCEDADVKAMIIARYGDDHVHFSNDLFTGPDDQAAAVDLMLLSGAKIMIAPFISIFSKCAAQVGDCAYMPLPLDVPRVTQALLAIVEKRTDEQGARLQTVIRNTAKELKSAARFD